MNNLIYIPLLSLFLIGCGSTDSVSSNKKSLQREYGSYKINIDKEERFILGQGCMSVTIKDFNDEIIATNSPWESGYEKFQNSSLLLSKGTYLFNYEIIGARTPSNTQGVLYYSSLNQVPDKINLNKKTNIPWNSANLYMLELTETTPISMSLYNGGIYAYNSSLEYIDNSNLLSRASVNKVITLDKGVYYILTTSFTSLNNCATGSGGSFSIQAL